MINLVLDYLKHDSQTVPDCTVDIDTKIVSAALDLSFREKPVAIVAADTADIVYLKRRDGWCHFLPTKVLGVPNLGPIKDQLLFFYAISSCDITSALFGKGKNYLALLNNSHVL